MKLSKETSKFALLAITLGLGFANTFFLNQFLGLAYLIVSLGLLMGQSVTRSKGLKIASRFWVIVFPFVGVLNGPGKLGWFLAFLLVGWIASKNVW